MNKFRRVASLAALRALDHPAVGWVARDLAVEHLEARAAAWAGQRGPLARLAETEPGCEPTVRGGAWLVAHGDAAVGRARLEEALEPTVCPLVGPPRYLRAVARARLADLARAAGDLRAAEDHDAARAQLWPQPDAGLAPR